MKQLFSCVVILAAFVFPSSVFSNCDLLLQHGITNITRYQSAQHAIAWKWHRNCGLDYNSASDTQVSKASVSVFGYGSGNAGYNSNQQREKLRKWCDQNAEFAESNSELAQEAEILSVPALSSWEQCIAMSRKQINIKFLPAGNDSNFIHFEIDSTHDGSLKYLGLKTTNYTCEESMVRTADGAHVAPEQQPDITHSNIQIDCERNKPKIEEKEGVGKISYEVGYIAVNTSGPSFSISFPEVVSEYYVTPPASVLAFDADHCPAGWSPYTPAYGRFIRGTDLSTKNIDPDGEREAGSLQDDVFKSHNHSYKIVAGTERASAYGKLNLYTSRNGAHSDVSTGDAGAGAVETRPKNVSLLYCKKNI